MLRSLFLAALCATVACTPPSRESAVLIPCPLEVVPGRETFDFSGGVTVGAADASLRPAADYLADALAAEGIGVRRAGADADVVLSLDPTLAPQAYRLAVARERIELRAASYEGSRVGRRDSAAAAVGRRRRAAPCRGDRRCAPLRMARRDARRGPSLLHPRRGRIARRPHGALQVQPAASPP